MKKYLAIVILTVMLCSLVSCSGNSGSSSSEFTPLPGIDTHTEVSKTKSSDTDTDIETTEEPATEPPTEHISPRETISAPASSQYRADTIIKRTEGSNTLKVPLAEFIEEGDVVSSFTFIIYSTDNSDIGQFKGGCGISVNEDCPAATDKGWFQSADFSAPTQGAYGKITWDVPADIRNFITPSGEVLFGYWWGNNENIRVDEIICTFSRTRDVPVDGTVSQNVGKSVSFSAADNTLKVPTTDFLPENAVPEVITFNISSSGNLGKFTGAFGYSSPVGSYQAKDTAFFTDSSSLSLTWFVPAEAKSYADKNGEITLGYWWSEQPSINLDSVTVKYSQGSGYSTPASTETKTEETQKTERKSDMRSPQEIVNDIKVGWNLGNTLESYNTDKTGLYTEVSWGNLKTTESMILAVRDAGFNAVRIPVTWGEHMDGDTIQKEWLDRVQEVVNYAYNNGMYVILNMHHDDYIWFNPLESEYVNDSNKLKAIWSQVADRFKDYGDTLLFEGMNEPRSVGSAAEWSGGTAEERAVINKYEQDFVNTIRASGGKNNERTLVITSYAASAETVAMNDVIIPKDKNIILSLHYYAPWKFANGETTTFTESDKNDLSAKFNLIKSKFIDSGTPVIIGEFGCIAAADDATRADYYQSYIRLAKSVGIKCFVWDNGISAGKDSYAIFKRGQLEWNNTILEGIKNASQ